MGLYLVGWWAIHSSGYIDYNDLTVTSMESVVSEGNHPQMALIQVSELV